MWDVISIPHLGIFSEGIEAAFSFANKAMLNTVHQLILWFTDNDFGVTVFLSTLASSEILLLPYYSMLT